MDRDTSPIASVTIPRRVQIGERSGRRQSARMPPTGFHRAPPSGVPQGEPVRIADLFRTAVSKHGRNVGTDAGLVDVPVEVAGEGPRAISAAMVPRARWGIVRGRVNMWGAPIAFVPRSDGTRRATPSANMGITTDDAIAATGRQDARAVNYPHGHKPAAKAS